MAAGDNTPALIKECSAVADKTPEGYGLSVEILGSDIQSTPKSVVTENWGVTVAADGTISKG